MIRSLFVVGFGISTLLMVSSKLLCDSYNDKACMEPQTMKNGYFVNQWTVHMPNVPKNEAKQELQNAGFIYLGQVTRDGELHLVTKGNTFEKHSMPDKTTIMKLKNIENVESVAQKHILPDSPDQVLTVDDTDNVRCESVDPDSIWLNDGRDNMKRVITAEEMEASVATYTARPISSMTSNDNDDDYVDTDIDDGDNAAPDSYAL